MREDIYLIISFDILTDRFDELSAIVNTRVENSRAEDGCLAYEFSTNTDRTTAYMIEHFESSSALISHIAQGTPEQDKAWNTHLSLASFAVFGEPDDELRSLVPSNATYTNRVGGFTK